MTDKERITALEANANNLKEWVNKLETAVREGNDLTQETKDMVQAIDLSGSKNMAIVLKKIEEYSEYNARIEKIENHSLLKAFDTVSGKILVVILTALFAMSVLNSGSDVLNKLSYGVTSITMIPGIERIIK